MANINPNPPLAVVSKYSPFKPWYTPHDMLDLGILAGTALAGTWLGKVIIQQFPKELTQGIDPRKFGQLTPNNGETNYFGLKIDQVQRTVGGLSLDDKRFHSSWFHWYASYYYGKTKNFDMVDDSRMRQWQTEINVNWFYIETVDYNGGGDRYTDLNFLPERRQALLQWSWNPIKNPADYGLKINF
jgi:hypothetical protein